MIEFASIRINGVEVPADELLEWPELLWVDILDEHHQRSNWADPPFEEPMRVMDHPSGEIVFGFNNDSG